MMDEQDINYLRYRGTLYFKIEDVISLLEITEFSKEELVEQLKEKKNDTTL